LWYPRDKNMWIEKLPARGRAAILWGMGVFLLAQLALTLTIERWRPDWGDLEYGLRFRNLRRCIQETPDRPLLVILGSSRTGNGFKADCLPPASWNGKEVPLVFNMSLAGGTPTHELLILKRLLAAGIRPRWVVIEVHEPSLNWEDRALANKDNVPPSRLRWSDLEVLDRYAPQHTSYRYREWLVRGLTSWNTNRYGLMTRYAPSWVEPQKNAVPEFLRHYMSPYGWLSFPLASVTPEKHEKWFEPIRESHAKKLANFRISPEADRLYREMLDTCQRENISVIGLLEMPEESILRNLYSSQARRVIHDYLTGLCEEYHMELIDATTWLKDENFADGHHVLPNGAEEFTLRFWRDVLEPRLRKESSAVR
jgi:hypothetical protein